MSEPAPDTVVFAMPTYRAMTLGDFIHELKQQNPAALILTDGNEQVGGFSSYRGFYEQIALVPVSKFQGEFLGGMKPLQTVGDVLAEANAAIFKKFQGYKGGEYVMRAHTELWFAHEGSASGWRPIGLTVDDKSIVRIILCGGL